MKIGITGGIGSGKSYIADILRHEYGIPVYDCDREAKRLNVESATIREGLVSTVGEQVYNSDGSLNRQHLAAYLFNNKDNAARINAIIHPVVADDFQGWANGKSKGNDATAIVAMESAILFESGFDRLVDSTIAVVAPTELCIERACRRDNADAEAIRRRIAMQMTNDERMRLADFTITNDGSDVRAQLDKILSILQKERKN